MRSGFRNKPIGFERAVDASPADDSNQLPIVDPLAQADRFVAAESALQAVAQNSSRTGVAQAGRSRRRRDRRPICANGGKKRFEIRVGIKVGVLVEERRDIRHSAGMVGSPRRWEQPPISCTSQTNQARAQPPRWRTRRKPDVEFYVLVFSGNGLNSHEMDWTGSLARHQRG